MDKFDISRVGKFIPQSLRDAARVQGKIVGRLQMDAQWRRIKDTEGKHTIGIVGNRAAQISRYDRSRAMSDSLLQGWESNLKDKGASIPTPSGAPTPKRSEGAAR